MINFRIYHLKSRTHRNLMEHHLLVIAQHHPDISDRQLRDDLIEKVIRPVVPDEMFEEDKIKYYIERQPRWWLVVYYI